MNSITESLFEMRDEEYAKFLSKLTPTVGPERFIGVRVPQVRELAKLLKDSPEAEAFLLELPHTYYDENMLHGILVSEIKDYDRAVEETDRFLPYIDNWSVCDIMSPKVFRKHKAELMSSILRWVSSNETYTIRFGIEMLMSHYLDKDFRAEYLEIPAGIRSEEYYVNMMIAWFFATALSKQWDSAIYYLENDRLDRWTHNKTIQKAVASLTLSDEKKESLKTLRRR